MSACQLLGSAGLLSAAAVPATPTVAAAAAVAAAAVLPRLSRALVLAPMPRRSWTLRAPVLAAERGNAIPPGRSGTPLTRLPTSDRRGGNAPVSWRVVRMRVRAREAAAVAAARAPPDALGCGTPCVTCAVCGMMGGAMESTSIAVGWLLSADACCAWDSGGWFTGRLARTWNGLSISMSVGGSRLRMRVIGCAGLGRPCCRSCQRGVCH